MADGPTGVNGRSVMLKRARGRREGNVTNQSLQVAVGVVQERISKLVTVQIRSAEAEVRFVYFKQ